MALGKPVGAEALDLLEAALGEIALIAARDHSGNHLVSKGADKSGALEGRHGAAQQIRLRAREARRDDGDPHRLFLKQRHAERLAEHLLQLLRGKGNLLLAHAASQVWMHHVALDRAGTHDRDFNHEIVETLRLQARQHRHLRAALDLENAHRVGARDHGVDARVFGGNRREAMRDAVMARKQVESLAQAGEHAERQHVDLEKAERVEIVLVPFDCGAALHRRRQHGNHFVEPVPGDDKTAGMLREMAGKAFDLLRERQRPGEAGLARVESEFRNVLCARAVRAAPEGGGGQAPEQIVRKSEGLADFADGALAAIGRDRGGQPCALAAKARVNILDHLLAPLMLEIDVDVGRLVALGGNEALEEQIVFCGIDLGDPQTKADDGIGRRAAPLRENSLFARKAHDVMHGEEIGGVFQFRNELEFAFEQRRYMTGNALRIAPLRAFAGKGSERLLLARKALAQFARIFVGEVGETKIELIDKTRAFLDRLRRRVKEPRHFLGAFQMPFGVGGDEKACFVERRLFADAG